MSPGGVVAVTVPGMDADLPRRAARREPRQGRVEACPAEPGSVTAAIDMSGFIALYESGYSRLVGQMTAVTGDVSEAEDVVQEAFVRAAQRWDRISGYDAPELWVRRVALNLAVSSLRRARRSATAILRWGRDLEPGALGGPDTTDLERLALVSALRRLPPRYRVVLAMHYLTDLDVRGIAGELDIPEATVKTRLARGRRRLREVLESAPTREVET
ncbi:MAG: sigma-70 family RNA polymerase sigma factor [Kineosporiaceae bacterium]